MQRFQGVSLGNYLVISSNQVMDIYVHDPGDQFWMWDLISPFKIPNHKLPLQGTGHLHIEKKIEGKEEDFNCFLPLKYVSLANNVNTCPLQHDVEFMKM
jgi:hypothetical protein